MDEPCLQKPGQSAGIFLKFCLEYPRVFQTAGLGMQVICLADHKCFCSRQPGHQGRIQHPLQSKSGCLISSAFACLKENRQQKCKDFIFNITSDPSVDVSNAFVGLHMCRGPQRDVGFPLSIPWMPRPCPLFLLVGGSYSPPPVSIYSESIPSPGNCCFLENSLPIK